MPIYEYKCNKCNAHIEVFQKITDKPLAKCRKCGGRLEKQFSAPAIQFKGSGWYVTDYANKNKSETTKSESESPATDEKKSVKKDVSPPTKASEKNSSTKVPSSD